MGMNLGGITLSMVLALRYRRTLWALYSSRACEGLVRQSAQAEPRYRQSSWMEARVRSCGVVQSMEMSGGESVRLTPLEISSLRGRGYPGGTEPGSSSLEGSWKVPARFIG